MGILSYFNQAYHCHIDMCPENWTKPVKRVHVIFLFCIKIISGGKGKSAVAASAYRSGEKADEVYGGNLSVHVRCLIDECTNIGNCDSSIFLGGKKPGTLKELNQALGKKAIDAFNTGYRKEGYSKKHLAEHARDILIHKANAAYLLRLDE